MIQYKTVQYDTMQDHTMYDQTRQYNTRQAIQYTIRIQNTTNDNNISDKARQDDIIGDKTRPGNTTFKNNHDKTIQYNIRQDNITQHSGTQHKTV